MMNNSQGASSFFSGLSTLLGRPHPLLHNLSDVSLLASAVSFQAFRERAYRYAAAKALAWVTMEEIDARDREHD